jgi:hypothetical protein
MQWSAVDLAGPALTPDKVSSDVRLLSASGDTLVLSDASLRGDSITGLRESGVPATVALSELQALQVRRISPAMALAPAFLIGFIVVPRTFSHAVRDPQGPVITDGS